jgi:hypothetical protein
MAKEPLPIREIAMVLVGSILVASAVYGILADEFFDVVRKRGFKMVPRSESPLNFWSSVAMWGMGGAFTMALGARRIVRKRRRPPA